MSQRFVLGLSSHFDDGNKILGKSKPAGQETKPQGFGGFGFFFPAPRWKNPGTGHGIIKIESVQKKLRSGRGLTNGLKNSIIEVLEGVTGIRYYED